MSEESIGDIEARLQEFGAQRRAEGEHIVAKLATAQRVKRYWESRSMWDAEAYHALDRLYKWMRRTE